MSSERTNGLGPRGSGIEHLDELGAILSSLTTDELALVWDKLVASVGHGEASRIWLKVFAASDAAAT